ncbi:MAG: M42 family metallopeptidase [Clostridia bacterium]|nr:M42 family metallopeptidase [Clostridia bacterium]MBQ5544050.1 M42 family metallopeptidase [Clostridia bacterium]
MILRETLARLSDLYGISGREDAVRDFILKEIEPYCETVEVSSTGCIIAYKKGRVPAAHKLMLCAHMDEVGMIVTDINENGLLKFATVGGIDRRVLCGTAVLVGDDKLPGVIGAKPIHLLEGDERDKAPEVKDLYIDVGALSKEEAMEKVLPGDDVVFDTKFGEFGDGLLKGKALDDRAGCAVLMELLKRDLPCDLWFVFSTMEEVGLRGAKGAAFSVAPDMAIVVESTTAADIPNVDDCAQVCQVGKGAVMSFMDRTTIYDRGMLKMAQRVAQERGIAWQFKRGVTGGNDAGTIHNSRGGVRTAAVSLPCRYLHSPCGVIAESDLNAVCELVWGLAEKAALSQ